MLCLLVLLASQTPTPPLPPYKRVDTVVLREESFREGALVAGDRLFAGGYDEVLCYDLRQNRTVWTSKERAAYLTLDGDRLLLTNDYPAEGIATVCLDANTGANLWRLNEVGYGKIAVDSNRLFGMGRDFKLKAVDLESRKTIWETQLERSSEGLSMGEAKDVLVSGAGLVVNVNTVTYGLNAKTGEVLWKETGSYLFNDLLVRSGNIVWVDSEDGSVARDIESGKVLWRSERGYSNIGLAFGSSFIGSDDEHVYALDQKTGRLLWEKSVGEENVSGGNQYGASLGELLYVRGLRKGGIFKEDGIAAWEGDSDVTIPPPVWTDGHRLASYEGGRILFYESGVEEAIGESKEARRREADRLVANWDKLDLSEKAKLKSLGDDAFEPLFKLFLETAAAYDAKKEDERSYAVYRKSSDVGDLLTEVTGAVRTADLLTALDGLPRESSAKPLILTLLGQHGEPGLITPFFIKELEGTETPDFEMYESNTYVAREYVANSSDPRAVAFMLKQLRDPKADHVLRYEAYVNLARTGGEEALLEVLKQRNHRKLLRPMDDRVVSGWLNGGEFGSKPKVLDEKKDPTGKTWGLLESGVLGSFGDLWIAEKQGDAWVRPVFMGITGGSPRRGRSEPEAPLPTLGGKTAEQLKSGAWFEFIANKSLRVDSDKDGLTDVVEKRLGTDRYKRDTDGDGDVDNLDPWPNVAAQPQTDEQKVMDAVFEARFHADTSEGPAIIRFKPGIEPFEMVGRSGSVIWQTSESGPGTLSELWEQGTAFIRFHTSEEEREGPDIAWNADRTEAKTTISVYYGGLNGTGYSAVVRKFGDQWVVVSMRMAYIS